MEVRDNLYKCTKCLIFQPKENFHKNSRSKIKIVFNCKTCCSIKRKKIYLKNKKKELQDNKEYRLKNKEKLFIANKKNTDKRYAKYRLLINNLKKSPCLDCGKIFASCVMDFDHREPATKKFGIAQASNRNFNDLLNELIKCDLVCVNCHRIREHIRKNKQIGKYHQWLGIYKNTPCMDCQQNFPSYVMDFDHIKEKQFTISKPPSQHKKFRSKIIEEINKCEVVCANCHRIRTFNKIHE